MVSAAASFTPGGLALILFAVVPGEGTLAAAGDAKTAAPAKAAPLSRLRRPWSGLDSFLAFGTVSSQDAAPGTIAAPGTDDIFEKLSLRLNGLSSAAPLGL